MHKKVVYVVGRKVHKSLKKAVRHARRIGARKILKYTLRPRRRR